MATKDENVVTSRLLLPITNRFSVPKAKKLQGMSCTYGIKASRVNPTYLASATSSQQDGPSFSAARPPSPTAALDTSKGVLLFGSKHAVQSAVDNLSAEYSGVLSLLLGSRVVTSFENTEYLQDCDTTQVMSAGHFATEPVAHPRGLKFLRLVPMPRHPLAEALFHQVVTAALLLLVVGHLCCICAMCF